MGGLELFLLITIVYVLYKCCLSGYRGMSAIAQRHQHEQQQRGRRRRRQRLRSRNGLPVSEEELQQTHNDIEEVVRTRNSYSEQTADGDSSSSNNRQASTTTAASIPLTTAQRKELVEKNLYYKRIARGEESVRELAMLLAASRVAKTATPLLPVDEINNNDNRNNIETNVSNTMKNEDDANHQLDEEQQQGKTVGPSNSATAAAAATSGGGGIANNIWNNILKADQIVDNAIDTIWDNAGIATTTHQQQQQQQCKIECSICLDTFTEGDEIAWAKDGSRTPSMAVEECDHIFHRECLVSWLQHHDECPLCRRLLVHADADVRFAGW